jgi:DNA-binding CsgD family transcriptional regulator
VKPATVAPHGLSSREVVVLRLVSEGLTDAHIAEHLVIGSHTVNSHLMVIYIKPGICSRTAARRYALEWHQSGRSAFPVTWRSLGCVLLAIPETDPAVSDDPSE